MKKNFFNNTFRFWRRLINGWSIIFFVLIIADLIRNNAYNDILNAASVIYISVLAIYVSNKEFERWYDRHDENHPGEIFVIIWSTAIAGLFIVDVLFGPSYNLPNAVISAYIAVLTILAITRKSKELYKLKRRR